jgi:multidrug resistance protein, MATE family
LSSASRLPLEFSEARANFRLAVPLALTQLASAAAAITSILLMGRAGADVLVAGTLAVHLFTFYTVLVGGILTGASPLMAHHFGAGRREDAQRVMAQAIKIAIVLTMIGSIIAWHTRDFLLLIGQPVSVADLAGPFAKANSFAFMPAMLLLILRNYAAAAGHPKLGLIAIVSGVAVNAFFGYGVMFGAFGLPMLGLWGLGVAFAGAHWFMFLFILVLVQSHSALRLPLNSLRGRNYIGTIIRIGVPIGLSGLCSVGTFVGATFVITLMGSVQVAGHGIAMQAGNFGFALIWGSAQATTIRIGWATGARDLRAVAVAAWTGLMNGMIVAIGLTVLFIAARRQIVGLFLDQGDMANRPTTQAAVGILFAVAIYQIANGTQMVPTSALRGLRDTKIPFLINLATFWLLGVVFAGILGFPAQMQAAGIWYGLSLAVAIGGMILIYRLRKILPRALVLTAD